MKKSFQQTKELRAEYLVVVNTKGGFCNSIKSFNSLLRSYDDIGIQGGSLSYAGMQFGYEVQTDLIGQGHQRFFHVKITSSATENIDEFVELLRQIKGILHKVGDTPPQNLWDDVSLFYAEKAYPLIYGIENLMRKLITKFMLTSLGVQWAEETSPDDVRQSIKPDTTKGIDYLYGIDFIQLSNFLFTKYLRFPVSQLLEKIDQSRDISEIDLNELKQFVPQSNWERYFSPIVDCDSSYLNKRWKQLYELRCKVAHNRTFNQTDYDRLCNLINEVGEKLQKALDNLDQVQVAEEERDLVAENMAGNLTAAYGEFLLNWKELVGLLQSLVSISAPDDKAQLEYYKYQHNVTALVKILETRKILDIETYGRINEYRIFRNTLVHQTDLILPEQKVRLFADRIKQEVSDIIAMLPDSILMSLADTEVEPNTD